MSGGSRPTYAELQAQLAELLEQQAATGEVLRAISASPSDPQGALDLVAASASRFAGIESVNVWHLVDG